MGIGSANPLLLATAASGSDSDPVTRSLRLVGPASSSSSTASETCNLKRTFSSAGNRKIYTVAFWVKRSSISNAKQTLFSSGGSGDSNTNEITFRDNDTLEYYLYPSTSMSRLATAAKFRDVSAWYHVTVAVDTTQATAANRVKMFVNGVQQTFETHTTYPDQNDESHFNDSKQHKFGEEQHRNRYNAEVLLADCYFIDGSAIEPVGNFIESTGYSSYKPKAFDMSSYSGNSFHLKFEDNSDIGSDSTSNSNDWSTTGISSHDVMLDTPTKNYATLNPLDAGGGTFSEGNLKWKAGGSHRAVRFTQAALAGDKTYFEVYYPDSWSNQPMIGLMGAEAKISDQQTANPSLWFRSNGYEYNNGSESNAGNPTWTNGDIVGVAVDLDAGELKYQVNGGSFTTAFTGLSSDTTWIPAIKGYDTSPNYIINTGADNTFAGEKTSGQDTSQSEFYYAPPTGCWRWNIF